MTSCLAALFVSTRPTSPSSSLPHGKLSCSRVIMTDESPGQEIRQSVAIIIICVKISSERVPRSNNHLLARGYACLPLYMQSLTHAASYRPIVPKYATVSSRLRITDASLDLVVHHALNRNYDSRICYGGHITCRDRVRCTGVGWCRPRCGEESHREAARLICYQGGWLWRKWREDILIDKVRLSSSLPWGRWRR